MTINSDTRPLRRKKELPSKGAMRVKILIAALLFVALTIALMPMTVISKRDSGSYSAVFQAESTLAFRAEADARVEERRPDNNTGTSDTLEVIQANRRSVETYLRFTVSGVTDVIQTARIRVYSTTDTSRNGPAVYAADNNWTETGITWNNRPQRLGQPRDNKDAIRRYSWVEYDVTALVTGDGTYSFALVADSNDAVRLSSRESSNGPQLIIALAAGTPTPAATPAATFTAPASPTPSNEILLTGAGDIATCDREQDELTAQLLDNIPGTIFTTGDNAYKDGTSTEFANCYDPSWGRHKARTKPVPGNHDYNTSGAAGYFEYFDNIDSYYAYDLGSWRIYALNSEIDVSETSAQVLWLQADLLANPRQCVLAYWHKPRWSSGSRHGDNPEMQTLWQIFYEAGAEVVINGHEHNYERFVEMDGTGNAVSPGLREFVVGTGGAGLYPIETPVAGSEVRNDTVFGVLKFTLQETGYEWEFVPASGTAFTDSGSGTCR